MNQPSTSASSQVKRALKIGLIIIACSTTATLAALLQCKNQKSESAAARAARI